ncbi:hypothetical protein chiPu_0008150 [Chiloscyllium punctatum]|uniref:Uncharacterized protein n=1 Tax=Chiloscyllium punctatum TaxID=137246 RepID=A0A401SH36_CHIPU|nr:hypothetical protein [Chiloscyllium punctatum]
MAGIISGLKRTKNTMQSKPKQYENIKRNESNTAPASGVLPRTFSGLEWINLTALEVDHDFEMIAEAENSVQLLSEALIYHFISAAKSNQPNATVNLEFVNKLLRRGAKIDTADKHGQTLLHEPYLDFYVECLQNLGCTYLAC